MLSKLQINTQHADEPRLQTLQGSPVKRETFSVLDFPMLVTLAGPR